MKWSELRKKAEEKGWYLYRHGSRHDIFLHLDKEFPIQIERHGNQEVRNGLYIKLKKQIGF
jgi:mRNA interferase HicA